MNVYLSKNIKYLRGLKDMTQAEIAHQFDLTASTITGWESDRSYPRFAELLKLRDLFGVDLERLVFIDLALDIAFVQEAQATYNNKYEAISEVLQKMSANMQAIEEQLAEALGRIQTLEGQKGKKG